MPRRNLDLWLVVIMAIVGLVAQMPGVPALVRAIGGLALVMFCPGYALTTALFPGSSLGRPERTVVVLGLSIAVTILGAVAFNWSPWGLQTGVWAGLTAGTTVAGAVVAALRRRSAQAPTASVRVHRAPALAQWVLLALAGLLTVGAVTWVRAPRPVTGVLGYTQLWMLPDETNANDVRVGISSSELGPTSYQLKVTLDGRLFLDEPEITLLPGGKWEQLIGLPVSQPVGVLEAVLYRLDDPHTVYRRVTLFRSAPGA